MELNLVLNQFGAWEPETDEDHAKIKKSFGVGEVAQFKTQKIRSQYEHHCYFAMLEVAFENQELYDNRETFRKLLQMTAGYVTPVVTLNENTEKCSHCNKKPNVAYIPESIAYANMDDEEFRKLRSDVGDVIAKRMLKIEDIEDEDVREQILRLANVKESSE
jgi:(2Fe-2S) ferredoxin